MDLKAIADALAVNFASVTATNGAETESATATADLPNSVATLALLVYPPENAVLTFNMGKYYDQYDFHVRLLRDPLNVPSRTQWLYAWATALRPLALSRYTLGMPTSVAKAEATGMRIEIEGEVYASVDGTRGEFDVVDLTVQVQMNELATGVNP